MPRASRFITFGAALLLLMTAGCDRPPAKESLKVETATDTTPAVATGKSDKEFVVPAAGSDEGAKTNSAKLDPASKGTAEKAAPANNSPAVGHAPLAHVVIDSALPDYQVSSGSVSGTIKSAGSDTMNNLMPLWAEGFKKLYPNVQMEMEGKGSSTAPPALIAGTSNFGPMSREMKGKEIDEFEKKYGYKPTQIRAAIDMLAVYVHRDNPIKFLTLEQVDAIFSKTRLGGFPNDVKTWGDLGLEGSWADKSISLYGRNSASGTNGFFKEHALNSGDFKDSVKEQPGSASVVQGVAKDRYAIGYSGIGSKTADVKAVPLVTFRGKDPVPAEAENAYSHKYPLARYLYLYLNYKPGSALDPLRREFIKYIDSKQGQRDVINDGYLPIRSTEARKNLKAVGLE